MAALLAALNLGGDGKHQTHSSVIQYIGRRALCTTRVQYPRTAPVLYALNQSERTALAQFSNTKTRIYFILQTGYFKAKQQFFNFSLDEASNDVQFIVRTYYSESASMSFTGRISRDYVRIQRQTLLSLFGYRNWTSDFALETQTHIGGLLRYFPKSHSAFRQLLAYFDHQKIIIPSYTFPLFDLLALSGVQLKMLLFLEQTGRG